MILLLTTLLMNLVIVLGLVTLLWLISLPIKNASIVDSFWGMGFVVVAWSSFLFNQSFYLMSILLVTLTTIWGFRLSLFLLWRNWKHGEDRRYTAMRTYHGHGFWWISFFTVFLLQGALIWFISMPLQVPAVYNSEATCINWLGVVGITIWLVGIIFETVGDWQLARFKADPVNESHVMNRGLWRYTRHPNYFGDFCVWWGMYLISINEAGWWTIGSPIIMSILLIKVSGVALLESTVMNRRPGYAEYQRKTSPFFPWPEKS